MIKITEKNIEQIKGRLRKFFLKSDRKFLFWESDYKTKSGKINPWFKVKNCNIPLLTYIVLKREVAKSYSGTPDSWTIWFDDNISFSIKIGDYIEFKGNRIIYKNVQSLNNYVYRVFEIHNKLSTNNYCNIVESYIKIVKKAINAKVYNNWIDENNRNNLINNFRPIYNFWDKMFEGSSIEGTNRVAKVEDKYDNIQLIGLKQQYPNFNYDNNEKSNELYVGGGYWDDDDYWF